VTAVDDLCAGRSCGGNGVCQADTGDCVCDVGCGPNCEWGIGSGVDCPEDVDDDDDDEGEPAGASVYILGAIVAVVILLGAGLCCYCKRRRSAPEKPPSQIQVVEAVLVHESKAGDTRV